MAFRCLFRCFYNIYNSSLGRTCHNCMISNRHFRRLRSNQSLDHSHVDFEIYELGSVRVKIVPVARTNYAYFIQDVATGELAIVDPGDADYINIIARTFFKREINAVLLTHKHWDHSAGIQKLQSLYPNMKVYASVAEKARGITHSLKDGEHMQLGSTEVFAIHTPGHTVGAVCFFVRPSNSPPLLFTGDTFFLGGMGAFFEGNARTVLSSINKFLALPENTLIFPGHEYSDTTLKFALYVEPSNVELQAKVNWVVFRRNRYLITIPSTVREERSYNPFVRVFTFEVQDATHTNNPLSALAKLQEMRVKDRGKYRKITLSIKQLNNLQTA